ncbi:proto-oncogene serine/threonine-protein kinase Pim-3 [Paragonimus westermani]|uniref:Proto-oncogene serine/threonine-protein kinase Pim-3 n=1 Tax=Paragonimus westermani TaxID=34504 RepID=A0A5J4NEG7_9TREM|nr:proto-oncogene serine/threonine-protein kinase Pim-3 [Paragonimus westermani]KAA3677432.1 proto-oncogene serine/threonine-protein kinase Pim-3 [Paragonimus westermani]
MEFDKFPKYSIIEKMSDNSTTSVFKAIRISDELPVVLKVFDTKRMNENMTYAHYFEEDGVVLPVPKEFLFLGKVQHIDGCVKMLDIINDSSNGKWILVLEDLEENGYINLAKELTNSGKSISMSAVSWIIKEVIDVLLDIHSVGILHCDLKPDNIFVDFKSGKVKLIDFNLSQELEQNHIGVIPGCTPDYAPPEVLIQRRPWTEAGEVWSLGCTAFVLLCRRFPFENPYLAAFSSPVYPRCALETSENLSPGTNTNVLFSMSKRPAFRGFGQNALDINDDIRLSPKAKDFLLLCLTRQPDLRPTLGTLLQHAFLNRTGQDSLKSSGSASFTHRSAIMVK